jgi:proteasome assembly chaperone (PAC2) family protein
VREIALLLAGISAVGITLGYMVGASATPVVSVAVPAVFGLVLAALGLLQKNAPPKELLEFLKASGEDAAKIPEIAEFRRISKQGAQRVGASLLVFSLSYIMGLAAGSLLRST